MKKSERVEFIQHRLEELYPNPPVPLNHHDPFTLLIAVLLSAQCTDERVNQVTPALFRLADTPVKMAKLPVEKIPQHYPLLRTVSKKIKSYLGVVQNPGQSIRFKSTRRV